MKADKECQDRLAEATKAKKEAAEAEVLAGQAAAARSEVAQQLAGTDRLLVQLGLEAHRAQLVDGEPCPLCGSTHHPGTGRIETTVAVLEAQKNQQSDRHAELQKRETTEKARAEARNSRALDLAKEIERWQGEFGVAADQWRSHGGAGDLLGTDSRGWLDAQALEVDAEAKAIAQQDQALVQLRRMADDARKSHEEVAGRVDKARSALKATTPWMPRVSHW